MPETFATSEEQRNNFAFDKEKDFLLFTFFSVDIFNQICLITVFLCVFYIEVTGRIINFTYFCVNS